MPQVTNASNANASAPQTKNQSEAPENQTQLLFDQLFSLVNELDEDAVKRITTEISQNGLVNSEAIASDTDNVALFSEVIISDKDTMSDENNVEFNTSFTNLIDTLKTLITDDNTEESDDIIASLSRDKSNKIGAPSINTENIIQPAQTHQGRLFSYKNVNNNMASPVKPISNAESNITTDKLSEVVKLVEQAICSRKSAQSTPENEASKAPSEVKQNSAIDEAIEINTELSRSNKGKLNLHEASSVKKEEMINLGKSSQTNGELVPSQDYKNAASKQAVLNSSIGKNTQSEIGAQGATRVVELSQHYNANTAHQTNIQHNAIDAHTGGDAGQDNNNSQPHSHSLKSHAPLSTIQKLNMADKAWKEALVRQVEMHMKDGGKSLELSLNPKQLGRMTVSIHMAGDTASVQISTETSAAANMLLESETKLAQMMQDMGLKLNVLQAGLSGKNNQNSNSDDNGKNSASRNTEISDDEKELDKTKLNNLDKSILNIVA